MCFSRTKGNEWFTFVANFSLICTHAIILKKYSIQHLGTRHSVPRKLKCRLSLLIPLFSLFALCQIKQEIKYKLLQENSQEHEYPRLKGPVSFSVSYREGFFTCKYDPLEVTTMCHTNCCHWLKEFPTFLQIWWKQRPKLLRGWLPAWQSK